MPLGGDAEEASSLAVEKYARMSMELLPPGKVWRLAEDSTLHKLLLGCAEELGRLEGRALDLVEESDPRTAVELLSEYERQLELESTGTDAERQARITAWLIARQRYRPVDFQTSLGPLLGGSSNVTVLEITAAQAAAMGDQREIFRFHVYPTVPGTYQLDAAQDLVNRIKPSHTLGYVIESVNFLCDDPESLTDRDLLGA